MNTIQRYAVLRSLLQHLRRHGFSPITVYDGKEYIAVSTDDETIEACTDVDSSNITCRWNNSAEEEYRCTLALYFDNPPEELVADYFWTAISGDMIQYLKKALDEYCLEWEDAASPDSSFTLAGKGESKDFPVQLPWPVSK